MSERANTHLGVYCECWTDPSCGDCTRTQHEETGRWDFRQGGRRAVLCSGPFHRVNFVVAREPDGSLPKGWRAP